MDLQGAMDGVPCPWCGAFSSPEAMCEICGSPMPTAGAAGTPQGLTVLPEPADVVTPIAEPTVVNLHAVPPLVDEPLLQSVRWPTRGFSLSPSKSNGSAGRRYRRFLDVRWLIESVGR